jgi:AcrR family transcriptional regulator/DNA-binding MarR family transcriptional regulator
MLMASAAGRIRVRRAGAIGPRGGGLYVSAAQRERLLDAAVAVVAEEGYRRMSVRRVAGRARVSSKTFYDLFADREDCFLNAFDQAVEELARVVIPAFAGEREWSVRIRAGLAVLLERLDGEPALRTLVFVEALGAGPRVLERRAEVLAVLQDAVDHGRDGMKAATELPALTAEGVVGAAFGVIYARLLDAAPDPLIGLLNPLMAMLVLPYRGHTVSARELSRPVPEPVVAPSNMTSLGASLERGEGAPSRTDFRLTVRTHKVLTAVGGHPGASNRQVSDVADVRDQGQISRLLARLEGLGLLRNMGGRTQGIPNAWQLTARGEEVAAAATPAKYASGPPIVQGVGR